MSNKKSKVKRRKRQSLPVFDIPRGRVHSETLPLTALLFLCVLMAVIWLTIILYIGAWSVSIPGILNLKSYLANYS